MLLGCYVARFRTAQRNNLTTCIAVALFSTASFAEPIPRPQFSSQFEAPHTDAPVQDSSIFAPVVAAVNADSVVPTTARDTDGLPSDAAQVSLDGTWKFRLESTACTQDSACEGMRGRWFDPNYDDASWRDLAVPGHFTRQIPVEELGGRGSTLPFNFAWYRRTFIVPDSLDQSRQKLRLLFEAVDYRADVWLDGVKLNSSSHLGTFNPFAFELPVLNANRPHTLVVRVQKPLDPGILACGDGTGPATDLKTTIDGTKGYWDGRPGGNDDNFDAVTKQSLHTGGIVRSVALTVSGSVRIDWVFITSRPLPHHRADVLVTTTLTNTSDQERTVTLLTRISGPGLEEPVDLTQRAVIRPGSNRVVSQARLRRIARWFPTGHPELGGPAMYSATTMVILGADDAARISDTRTDRFGVRSIGFTSDRCEDRFATMPPDPACADAFDYTAPRPPQGTVPDRPIHQFFFNGRRIFLRGAGTDPDAWVANIDRRAADRHMELIRSINGNHLGMAVQIAPPVFYDAADDAGIALVQDFELQWTYNDVGYVFACTNQGGALPTGMNDNDRAAATIDNATRIAADEIYLFYNHPSIIQWVMHNEPTWELVEVLGDSVPIIRVLANVGRTLDRRLVDLATAIDRTRPVKAAAGVGDSHIYSGYLLCSFYDLLGLDPARTVCNAESTRTAPFPSEFGAQIWPFSAKRWMDPASLFPADRTERRHTWTETNPKNPNEVVPWLREWTYHAHQPETMATYVGSPADYDRFQDYAFASQLYQRAFLKFYIEHYRKDLFRPTAGLRFFFFRGFWDQAYFDIFDQYDLPAAAVAAVRNAYAPMLVTSQIDKPVFHPGETIHLPIWVVNDRYRPIDRAKVVWRIVEVEDAFVIRGVLDTPNPPYQDARRAFLGLAEALPPHPVITTVPRAGAATIGRAVQTGSVTLSLGPNAVSPPSGERTLDFTAPQTDTVRHFVLQLELRQGRTTIAHNEHLITVGNLAWVPPPGLSDGIVSYGEEPGDRPLRFALTLEGLEAGQQISLDVPAYAGALDHVDDGIADADGVASFPALTPDEYVVRSNDTDIAHFTLTEDRVIDVR